MGLAPEIYDEGKVRRTEEAAQEAYRAAAKAAAVACVSATVATLVAVRKLPWAKANINHTGQALIVSAATISSYLITLDKSGHAAAKRNTHFGKSP